jgi:hypothetical protein
MALDYRRLSEAERLSHFRNLVVMSLKDGAVCDPERDLLSFLAAKWGLLPEQAKAVLEHPDRHQVQLAKETEARFHQLFDLTELMIIDGEMRAKERELCMALAAELGFDEPSVRIIIEEILGGNQRRDSEAQIHARTRTRLVNAGKWK